MRSGSYGPPGATAPATITVATWTPARPVLAGQQLGERPRRGLAQRQAGDRRVGFRHPAGNEDGSAAHLGHGGRQVDGGGQGAEDVDRVGGEVLLAAELAGPVAPDETGVV